MTLKIQCGLKLLRDDDGSPQRLVNKFMVKSDFNAIRRRGAEYVGWDRVMDKAYDRYGQRLILRVGGREVTVDR